MLLITAVFAVLVVIWAQLADRFQERKQRRAASRHRQQRTVSYAALHPNLPQAARR